MQIYKVAIGGGKWWELGLGYATTHDSKVSSLFSTLYILQSMKVMVTTVPSTMRTSLCRRSRMVRWVAGGTSGILEALVEPDQVKENAPQPHSLAWPSEGWIGRLKGHTSSMPCLASQISTPSSTSIPCGVICMSHMYGPREPSN